MCPKSFGISPKIDFNSPVTHLFDTDGNRVEKVDDLEDRGAYVASNSRRFKPGNYGKLGDKFLIKKKKARRNQSLPRSGSSTPSSAASKPNSANSKVIKIVNHILFHGKAEDQQLRAAVAFKHSWLGRLNLGGGFMDCGSPRCSDKNSPKVDVLNIWVLLIELVPLLFLLFC